MIIDENSFLSGVEKSPATPDTENTATEELNAEEWSVVSQNEHKIQQISGDHDDSDEDDDEDEYHLYPPFPSAGLNEMEPVPSLLVVAPVGPILQRVEVNAETGTIHFEAEQPADKAEQDHSQSKHSDSNNSCNPVNRLTVVQKFWLIVFVRTWARKIGATSKNTAIKYHSKIKPLVLKSVTAMQKESKRAAAFVCEKSAKFDEKHQVRDKAKTSMQHVCRHVKHASKASAQGVKMVSKSTINTMKEVEQKHHVMRKSKNSIKKGGRMIRNALNGKPLNARPVRATAAKAPDNDDHLDHPEELEDHIFVGKVLEADATVLNTPSPSAE